MRKKYIILGVFLLYCLSILIGLGINDYVYYQEHYQEIMGGNYDPYTQQKNLEDLEAQTHQQIETIIIVCILFAIIIFGIYLVVLRIPLRRNFPLFQPIKKGTARIQYAKIITFRYEVLRNYNHILYGYHVLVENNDHQIFESDFLDNAKVYDVRGKEVIGKELDWGSLVRTGYTYQDTDNLENVEQSIGQEIKQQMENDSGKMNYLIYQDQIYHIGDAVEVYLHPDDEHIYYVNL